MNTFHLAVFTAVYLNGFSQGFVADQSEDSRPNPIRRLLQSSDANPKAISGLRSSRKLEEQIVRNSRTPTKDVSADDVYSGLSDLFDKKGSGKKQFQHSDGFDMNKMHLSKPNAYLISEADMWQSKETGSKFQANDTNSKDSPLDWQDIRALEEKNPSPAEVIDDGREIKEDYWTRIKGILGNMRSILERMYPPERADEKAIFSTFDKVFSFGDKVNVLNRLRETFDHELLEFLGSRWQDIKDNTINNSPILKLIFSTNTRTLTGKLVMKFIKQIGTALHNQAFTHLSELDFVTELMKTSGFKDKEIHQVFFLLDLPTDTVPADNGTLEFESRMFGFGGSNSANHAYNNNGFIDKSGGYGGGGGGEYYEMDKFDPFILIAGLAFAAFLAYLIYRLLSSTTGRKRSVPDMSIALDLSDLPDVVGNIYTWLEKTEKLYGSEARDQEIGDSFSRIANQLWSSFQADRISKACVKRFLCDHAQQSSYEIMGGISTLEGLALTSLAHIFGEGSSAKMVDNLQSQLLEGKTIACHTVAPQCDDFTYSAVHESKSNWTLSNNQL